MDDYSPHSPHPTLEQLRQMNELEFEAAVGLLELAASLGDLQALDLVARIDQVIDDKGTFE